MHCLNTKSLQLWAGRWVDHINADWELDRRITKKKSFRLKCLRSSGSSVTTKRDKRARSLWTGSVSADQGQVTLNQVEQHESYDFSAMCSSADAAFPRHRCSKFHFSLINVPAYVIQLCFYLWQTAVIETSFLFQFWTVWGGMLIRFLKYQQDALFTLPTSATLYTSDRRSWELMLMLSVISIYWILYLKWK